MDRIAARPEETVGGYAEGRIVVYHRDRWRLGQNRSLAGLPHDSMVRRIGVAIKIYVGLDVLRFVGANSESVGDSRQIGQGPSSHFSHYMAAMDLYRDLAHSQLCGNQFVHHAGSNEGQHV